MIFLTTDSTIKYRETQENRLNIHIVQYQHSECRIPNNTITIELAARYLMEAMVRSNSTFSIADTRLSFDYQYRLQIFRHTDSNRRQVVGLEQVYINTFGHDSVYIFGISIRSFVKLHDINYFWNAFLKWA